jgi:hypothetical protein
MEAAAQVKKNRSVSSLEFSKTDAAFRAVK